MYGPRTARRRRSNLLREDGRQVDTDAARQAAESKLKKKKEYRQREVHGESENELHVAQPAKIMEAEIPCT